LPVRPANLYEIYSSTPQTGEKNALRKAVNEGITATAATRR